MSTTKKKVRIDPAKVYVAIESFAGERFATMRGDRLRGSNEAVQAAPELFVEDGADDREIGEARAARLGFLSEPEPEDRTAPKVLGAIPAERRLVVTKAATFRLEDGSMVRVREGDVVDANEPWVQKARRAKLVGFRKPTKAEANA